MEKDMIVTLEDNAKYYLTDETEQNGIKYFLGNKLDENDETTTDSCIFEEVKDGDDIYLDEVPEGQTLDYIAAVFISNAIKNKPSEN